jgi:membrane protein
VGDAEVPPEAAAPPRPPFHRRVWPFTVTVAKGLFAHHAFDHAATMAFYFFLGAIPLLLFAGLLIGNVVQREGAEALAAPLYRAMPRAAADLFRNELNKIADTNTKSIAPISLGGFLWLTTNGVHNLMDVFELLVGAQPRSWGRQRLIALVWVVAGFAAVAAMTWLLLFLNGVASGGIHSARQIPALLRHISTFLAQGWQRVGVLVVFTAMLGGSLALFYRTAVVHPRAIRRHVWTGTIVALLLWGLISWAFGAYVTSIAHYAVFYGSLATVAVTLLWLYLTSLALLIGAEVNANLEGTRELLHRISATPTGNLEVRISKEPPPPDSLEEKPAPSSTKTGS